MLVSPAVALQVTQPIIELSSCMRQVVHRRIHTASFPFFPHLDTILSEMTLISFSHPLRLSG